MQDGKRVAGHSSNRPVFSSNPKAIAERAACVVASIVAAPIRDLKILVLESSDGNRGSLNEEDDKTVVMAKYFRFVESRAFTENSKREPMIKVSATDNIISLFPPKLD